jgi:hypothetical protein
MNDLLTAQDYAPFERVAINRLRDADGEPTGLVDIVGIRDGDVYHVQVPYADLWDQMGVHMEWQHGKSLEDPMTPQELAHATIRAAIILLSG